VTADYDSGPHGGFVDFYRAMKRVDPSIDVCASWATTDFVDLMGDDNPYDCLGVHEHLSTLDKTGTPEQVYDRLMTSATGMLALLTDLDTAMRHDRSPRDRPYLAVSEYGALLGSGNGFPGMRNSLMAAEWMAELVTGFVQHDVHYAEMSNLNDPNVDQVDNLFGSAPDFVYTARANVLALFSQLAGGRPVETDITGNPEAPGGYTSLQVLGVRRSADDVQVLVLNRDRTNAVTPQFVMDGIQGGRLQVRVSSVSAESFQSYNSPDQPDAVTTTVTSQTVDGNAVNQEVPAHSVSLLDISRR
jgi:alpha-N-arabinofuranosidase